MLGSVLPFSPDLADRVSEYCEKHSEELPESLDKHWEWTVRTWMDAEMMSSKLQGQWMIWMSQWMAPKRVLEVGTFTGFSALAWYEGTRATNAEIITLDVRGEVLNFTRKMFKELGVDDRIRVIEGPAASMLEHVEGQFDLIFLDADKHNYQLYMNRILERRLLSPHGVVLVDNVFARGLTMGNEFNPYIEKIRRPFWEANGETLRKLNKSFLDDPRIDTLILPLFDGVTQIKWRAGYLERQEAGAAKQ
ncbi:hypothetical protein OEA41_003742 [Lepraria neglecta]|uniref:O-methyltransferase n=1 Tax=Lepraria neglecta TaxID=209136 RepID=A0AAE0DLR0_9LECA|nr:hypothetical protein OEA41_003742 [Lepraria neglecta]